MKPYEYRYQVRVYFDRICDSCGHNFRQYDRTLWEEPEARMLWPTNLRIRSAYENAAENWGVHLDLHKVTFWASPHTKDQSPGDGYAVGRCDQDGKFHEDFHVLASNNGSMPAIGAL